MQGSEKQFKEFEDLPNLEDIPEIGNISDLIDDNRRITTRYVRDDIRASVNKIKLFRFAKPIAIELFDLSTRGALLLLDKNLKINKKLVLILEFDDGKKFQIPAKIVRKISIPVSLYGIKFDSYNNALGDYLLETQTNLVFK